MHTLCLTTCYTPQKFVRNPGVPLDTALRVYKRYLKLEPTHTEEFMAYLRIKVSFGSVQQSLVRRAVFPHKNGVNHRGGYEIMLPKG